MKKISFFFSGVLAVVLILIFAGLLLGLQPADASDNREIQLIVERGLGSKEIIKLLSDRGLIKSSLTFKLYSILNGTIHLLKPGRYSISPSWSAIKINRLLANGVPAVTVTIKEGETLKDIDHKLSQSGIIKAGELSGFDWNKLVVDYPFLDGKKSLEGFLFPDTYEFSPFTPVDNVVKEFLNNFKAKAWPALANSEKDTYNVLIVGSLLEKEAPLSRDRALIAGIIYKRMKLGMPLQVDAASAYYKCNQKFSICDNQIRTLSREDFAQDNPYNTYRRLGLPPTPIANPGLDAIRAAINPVTSPYFYYISDPITKKTIFAVTLDEHNENRVKYLNRN